MDELVQLLNRIQEVFTVVGLKCGIKSLPELPQIIIIGAKGSGKSSILERLVGRPFLPHGPGSSTRRPLMLQLIYSSKKDLGRVSNEFSSPNLEAWACFSHKSDHHFIRFEDVRQEIIQETSRLAGEDQEISVEPIHLKIFSNSVNLTFVDLPGLIPLPVGDQPNDTAHKIRDLVLQYISIRNSIIVVVIPANSNINESEPLKLAQQVDQTGERTLVVLTKLDLVDEGVDLSDILRGRTFIVPIGLIGIVNRSQQDIVHCKTTAQTLVDEANFLKRHFPKLASRNGVPFLARTLQYMLIDKIRSFLPEIKSSIMSMTNHYQTVLKECGESVFDKGQVILNIITEYCSMFNSCIKGNSVDLDTSELREGARISYIFQEIYSQTLNSIDPLAGYSQAKILTAMRNASGTCPGIFIPETSFELLVKQQIKLLEEPSIQCVNLVYQELERVVINSAKRCMKDLQRFYNLHRRIYDISSELIRTRLPETHKTICQLVAIQMAYINTSHPDFVKEMVVINTFLQSKKQGQCELDASGTILKDGGEATSINPDENNTARDVHLVHVEPSTTSFAAMNNSNSTDSRKDVIQIFDDRAQSDCIIIEELIKCYFNIIRKNVEDFVPKTIMHCLVNYVMDNLQPQLVSQLYQPDMFEELLAESKYIIDKRKEINDIIKVLDKATEVINEIRDYHTLAQVW